MSQAPAGKCRLCGGALQRVTSMPGHLVCGSGHLFLEHAPRRPGLENEPPAHLHRVGHGLPRGE